MEPSIKRCTLALIMCGIFMQAKATQDLPFSEDFSTFESISFATTECNGWTLNYCVNGTTSDNTGLWFQSYNSNPNSNKISKAITPVLNLFGNAKLSFKIRASKSGTNPRLLLSITNGKFNDGTKSKNISDILYSANNYYNKEYCIIGTGNTQISFKLNSTADKEYFIIDDVTITTDAGTTINISDATDNSSEINTYNNQIVDVATTRTLTGGIWNTLCLPFNVTKATMEAVLGENQDVQLRTYTGFADNVMTFSEVTGDDVIAAGTPFLLKLNTTVPNPTFNSVTVSNSTAAQTVTHEGVSFIGTYSQKQLATDGTELFITTSGGLAIPTATGNVMNGMRAYIKVPESMKFTPNGVRLAIDNETTSIQSVMTTSQPDAVYNLSGQRLQQPRKGLNIVRKNGKLIFIR